MHVMLDVDTAHAQLQALCAAISEFEQHTAVYHAPVIDHHHPGDYGQKSIAGLSRFHSIAKHELKYLESVSVCNMCLGVCLCA
jgi:hypothetical protein